MATVNTSPVMVTRAGSAEEGRAAGSSPARREHPLERGDEVVGRLAGDDHRWLELEHVLPVAGRLDDDAEFQHPVTDGRRLLGRRLTGLPVPDQLHAQIQTAT